EDSVDYRQFIVNSQVYFRDNIQAIWTKYRFPDQFLVDCGVCLKNNKDNNFFLYIAILTVAWTVFRQVFTNQLVKVSKTNRNSILPGFCFESIKKLIF